MNKNIFGNFKDFDLAFIDTETTGRGFEHEIIEIGVVRASAFNLSILDEWEVKIKPKKIEIAEEEALKINHYNPADWEGAIEKCDAMKTFLEKTEGTVLVAHNLPFDWFYIHKTLNECGLEPTFWFKGLDTVSLAWLKLRNDPAIKSLSFRELNDYFGIKNTKPHSAMGDARAVYDLFAKLSELK
ncbi:MAG: 3'-5' exonuclease [Candidatus Paceibacterota bacterium]